MFFVSIFSGLENDYLHATIHCVSCSFFCSKGIGYISSFGLIAGVYYLYQSFYCFQERYSVWRNRRIEQGSMLHHLSFLLLILVSYVCEKITFTLKKMHTNAIVEY